MGRKTFRRCLLRNMHSGFGGLEIACWPLVPKFAGSNPAEKYSALLSSEGK